MRLAELKYEFIRTPLERPLQRLRRALGAVRRGRHPELREIHLEDERLQAVLARVLRPGSNCVDAGCHYGSMLSQICRLAPGGRHAAFEVVPAKVRFLRRKFPEVEVFELGLFDRAGSATFYVCRRATALSSLSRQAQAGSARIEVTLARLDDVLPADRAWHFLKLDVEGAELPVLRGARATLARHRPVVLFECGPGGPEAFGYQPGDLHDFFTSPETGYDVFFLKDFLGGGRPVGRADFEQAGSSYPFLAFNWLAVPRPPAG